MICLKSQPFAAVYYYFSRHGHSFLSIKPTAFTLIMVFYRLTKAKHAISIDFVILNQIFIFIVKQDILRIPAQINAQAVFILQSRRCAFNIQCHQKRMLSHVVELIFIPHLIDEQVAPVRKASRITVIIAKVTAFLRGTRFVSHSETPPPSSFLILLRNRSENLCSGIPSYMASSASKSFWSARAIS